MIVCVGEALIDLFAAPRGSEISTAESFIPCVGGAPLNVAVTVGRLGTAARLITAVGRDGHGERITRTLDRASVDSRFVFRCRERTGVTFVRVALDGSRAFLFYRRDTADAVLARHHLDAVPHDPLDSARWLVVGSTALASPLLAELTLTLVQQARVRNIPIFLDLNCRLHLWPDRASLTHAVGTLCALASVVKASEDDLTDLGVAPTIESVTALAPDAVSVLTLGQNGCAVKHREMTLTRPAIALGETAVIDTTGAGDAFVAGLLVGLGERGPSADLARWGEALTLANCLGAQSVTAVGALTALDAPWRREVIEALASTRAGQHKPEP